MKSQSKNSEASPVLSVRGLSKTYRAGDVDVHALRGVNLDLYAGEGALTEFRRDHVGFVFQFYNLIPSLTAEENIALVTDISTSPMPPKNALDLVGLAERATRRFSPKTVSLVS